MSSLETVIQFSQQKNRICPNPKYWNKLWEELKNKKQVGNGWIPSLPLILAAWHHTTDEEKRSRFLEHLNWAEKENQLVEIKAFLEKLAEDDWHHT